MASRILRRGLSRWHQEGRWEWRGRGEILGGNLGDWHRMGRRGRVQSEAHEGLRHPLQGQVWGSLIPHRLSHFSSFYWFQKENWYFKKKHLYLQIKTIVGSTAAKHYLRSPQGPGKTITLSGGEQVLFRDGVKRPMLNLPKSTTGERLSSVSQAGSTGRSFTRQQAAPSHYTEQLSVWPPQGEVGALKGSHTLSLDLGSRTNWSL